MPIDVREWLRQVFSPGRASQQVSAPEVQDETEDQSSPYAALMRGQFLPVTIHGESGSIAYHDDEKTLFIRFPDTVMYSYFNVSPAEAKAIYDHKDHVGTQVWDRLRRRGTLWGYQRPFAIVSDPEHVRMWSRNRRGQQRHAIIPPSGSFPGWSPTRRL